MSGEDDLLERATRALRAAPPPSEEELRIERAVLLRAHRAAAQKSGGKSRALRWVLPLAAVLTAGSALAATTGQLERAVEAVSAWLDRAPESAGRTVERSRPRAEVRKPSAAPNMPAPVARTEPTAAPVEPAPTPTVATKQAPPTQLATQRAEPVRRTSPRRRASEATEPEPREEAIAPAVSSEADAAAEEPAAKAPNADLLRYREAHRLHFRERDMWSALKAWESYLSTYPHGTFAIEARYNRAICLVRLNRKDEARRALAPFAAGDIGRGYRKAEASELLKALE